MRPTLSPGQLRSAGCDVITLPRPLTVSIISPTFGGYGGLEAFVLTLCAGLAQIDDLDVRLYFKRTARFALQPELAAEMESAGDRVQFVNRGGRGLFDAIARADVVHIQNPSPDATLLAKAMCRPLLINVINHRVSGYSWRQRLWGFCLRRGDRRFYISDFVRRTWEGDAVLPGSRVVFPICRLANDPKPPAKRRGFVFAGRWIANKGVDTLIEAYAQAGLDPQAWPLTLLGDGPMRTALRERVKELELSGIEMPGFLGQEAKAEAIRSARFMVVPPDTAEDFGLTAIEARHLGVPCIITRDGGLPEAAGDEALSCEPGDIAALAECLKAAAAMSADEYEGRSVRTYSTLLPALVQPSFYGEIYRDLADRRNP